MNYSQCKLQNRTLTEVAWIPTKFAIVGKSLRIRCDGVWVEGWVVREVWQTIPEDKLPDEHAERKAHKRATGDVGG